MKDDLISRQAAIDAFGFSEKTRKYGGDHSGYDTLMKYEIQNVLEGLPSVTPQPKIGHWIEERTYMECPKCHDIWHYEENQTERFKFCPTCGKGLNNESKYIGNRI